jgi:hypothetical protein
MNTTILGWLPQTREIENDEFKHATDLMGVKNLWKILCNGNPEM